MLKTFRSEPHASTRRFPVRIFAIGGCSALAAVALLLLAPQAAGLRDLADHTYPTTAASSHPATPSPRPSATTGPLASAAPGAPAQPVGRGDDDSSGRGSGDSAQAPSDGSAPVDEAPIVIPPPIHIDPPYEPPYSDAEAQAAVVNAYAAVPVFGDACFTANSGTWGRTSPPPPPSWGGILAYEAGALEDGTGGWVQYFSCD